MDWILAGEVESEFANELDDKELSDTELDEVEIFSTKKVVSARRAIEILREQKQLEADTWDYFQ